MNSSVPLPVSRLLLARSKALRRSCTPEKIADSCSKASCVSSASRRATVVLPEPGGPHRIMLCRRPLRSMRVSVPSGPTRWSWPTTSASRFGRNRSASGRGAPFSRPAASNRLLTLTRDLQLQRLGTTLDDDLPHARLVLERTLQLAHGRDLLATDLHDHVALLEAQPAGGRAGPDRQHDHAVLILDAELV